MMTCRSRRTRASQPDREGLEAFAPESEMSVAVGPLADQDPVTVSLHGRDADDVHAERLTPDVVRRVVAVQGRRWEPGETFDPAYLVGNPVGLMRKLLALGALEAKKDGV